MIADVTAVLRDLGVSLESMLQRGRAPGEAVPVVLVTHETQESAMRAALERIAALDAVVEQPALIRIERTTFQPERNRNPVSVGGGASTGSYGSVIGLGIGIDLSGRPPAQVATRLGVMIRERASDTTLWEGRASFTVRADAPLAQTQLGAAKMAEAMFRAFPGNNGETVDVQ